ncbi:hypothetical protein GCM10023321_85620 [Pseudonocardia eucalypti]|uniref:Uncharacterized protein n=1 Tax=Pseudonocardia eucalypti TaxID=648755 RepID=A0ABP9RGE6_9PSEU
MGVFATLENTFRWLVTGPYPLAVHPRRFPDLPDLPVPLDRLRALLASPAVCASSRAAVWSYLVRQARTSSPDQAAWTVAAAAVALPDLMRIVATLSPPHRRPHQRPELRAELEAAALGGFLSELRRHDHNDARDPRIRWLLLMSAYRGARALRDTTTSTSGRDGTAAPENAPTLTQRARASRPARRPTRQPTDATSGRRSGTGARPRRGAGKETGR